MEEPQKLDKRYYELKDIEALLRAKHAPGTWELEEEEDCILLVKAPTEITQLNKMSTISASDSVREQLNHARVTTVSNAHIILNEDLDKILNEECLKQVIGGYDLKHMRAPRVIDKIASKMEWKKTFALLLYIGAGNLIEAFIEKGLCIPVKKVDDKDLCGLIKREAKRNQFHTDQRIFDAPVFEHQISRKLSSWSRLPFLEEKPLEDQGANSKIFEVIIPQSSLLPQSETLHQLKRQNKLEGEFSNGRNVRRERCIVRYKLIRKELEDNDAGKYELGIHKELDHQCIIPLYASYRFGKKINLLLPKCGKRLKAYFQENTPWSETQYLSAIHGLSDALRAIHNLSTPGRSWTLKGSHGDLKPSNVLVDGYKFILIDFGLAMTRQPSEGSGGSNRMTGPYAAPECSNSTADACLIESFGACDIWSFGCILAELVVFMDAPNKNVFTQYDKNRKSTQGGVTRIAFHKFGQHNEGTWAQLDAIEKNNQSTVIKNLVNLIRGMLQIDHRRRPDAKTVTETIADIMEGRPYPGPNLQSAPGSVNEVQAVIEPPGNKIFPSIASADQGQAALQSRKSEIGQRVKNAYAQFDRRSKQNRKADLEVILKSFLDGQTDLTRLEVDDVPLDRDIQWGLMVTEKELSWCRRFDLATRLEHIQKAEQCCERVSGVTSQDPNTTNAVRLRLETNIIKGMKARLKFREGADKDQVEGTIEHVVGEIDKALLQLEQLDKVRYTESCGNIIGWRDRIIKPLI